MIEGFIADPQWLRVRITSAVDAVGTTFRFAPLSIATTVRVDLFDAGEIDETGRIALILTFVDPLPRGTAGLGRGPVVLLRCRADRHGRWIFRALEPSSRTIVEFPRAPRLMPGW